MRYKCYVELVPKGKAPRRANSVKVINFDHDKLEKSKLLSRLYKVIDRRKNLDSYVIRNHWEIFKIDAEFKNPPFEGFSELTGKLISFDEATGWKSSANKLYISVRSGKVNGYIRKIQDYYAPLNPRVAQSGIVAVDTKPTVKN